MKESTKVRKSNANWYAIRTIYKFGKKKNGRNIYEERIVAFSGKNWDEAWGKALRESKEYSKQIGFGSHRAYSIKSGYMQDGDKLIDGYELWSELSESDLGIRKFYSEKYTKFNYTPDKK